MKSSTPVTVTVCGVFQLAALNVNEDVETAPSAVFGLAIEIVTFAVGWLVSTTVNDACAPASVVVSPLVGVTVTPAVSLSILVTETSETAILLYVPSVLDAAPVTME